MAVSERFDGPSPAGRTAFGGRRPDELDGLEVGMVVGRENEMENGEIE